jgi:hypothetical protein
MAFWGLGVLRNSEDCSIYFFFFLMMSTTESCMLEYVHSEAIDAIPATSPEIYVDEIQRYLRSLPAMDGSAPG